MSEGRSTVRSISTRRRVRQLEQILNDIRAYLAASDEPRDRAVAAELARRTGI